MNGIQTAEKSRIFRVAIVACGSLDAISNAGEICHDFAVALYVSLGVVHNETS